MPSGSGTIEDTRTLTTVEVGRLDRNSIFFVELDKDPASNGFLPVDVEVFTTCDDETARQNPSFDRVCVEYEESTG